MQSAGTSILLLASAALLSCDGAKTIEGFPDEFAGVGLELGRHGERLLVVRPIEGGPSWEAGIRRDDEVISINGEPVTDLGLGDAVARLRGPPETQLTLGLDRHGEKLIVVLRRKKLTKVGDDYHAAADPGEDPGEGAADPGEGDDGAGEAGARGEGAAGDSADEHGAKDAPESGEALAAGTAATPASAVEPPPTSVEAEQPTKRQRKPTKSNRRGKRGQKHKK